MIKLVAFDWNGTLFADTQTIVKADNLVYKKFGQKSITLKQFRECFHVPILDYWKNLGFNPEFRKKNADKMEKFFSIVYEPLADKTRSRAGSKKVLKYIKKLGIQSIIYSNHTLINIEKQLKRLGMSKLITKTLARDDGDYSHLHARGKTQKLNDYVKTRGFKPQEVLSIGDTEEEIEIGKKYGYHTVAITGGYNSTPRLKKHHPDFLIHNMLELKKIVRYLNTI